MTQTGKIADDFRAEWAGWSPVVLVAEYRNGVLTNKHRVVLTAPSLSIPSDTNRELFKAILRNYTAK
jgi:hypothetical protein